MIVAYLYNWNERDNGSASQLVTYWLLWFKTRTKLALFYIGIIEDELSANTVGTSPTIWDPQYQAPTYEIKPRPTISGPDIQYQTQISTPELFSFAHDWGREELWGTLKQASFSLVFARNKEHAHDWLIQIKSLLNALLCQRRLLQINLVLRVLSLLRESTLVAAGHVSARFLQIPEMWLKGGAARKLILSPVGSGIC